jgi:hypothetical protein
LCFNFSFWFFWQHCQDLLLVLCFVLCKCVVFCFSKQRCLCDCNYDSSLFVM